MVIEITRDELCCILDALENLEEDYKHWGGIHLIQEELDLFEKLNNILKEHDKEHRS